MKRTLCIVAALLFFLKVQSQPSYDVEIDGLRYTVNVEELTAALVDVNPVVSNVNVPPVVVIGTRTFVVNQIVLRFGYYNYEFIRSLTMSNRIIDLDLGLRPSISYYYQPEPFPIIHDLIIPCSVKSLSVGCITGLKTLTIPPNVERVNMLNNLPDLETLIVDDDPEDLIWQISYNTSNHNKIVDGFYNMRKVEYVYLGRQFRGTYCFGYGSHGSGNHVYPQTVIIGPYVKDLTGYNIYPNNVHIPNTVDKGCFDTVEGNGINYNVPDTVVFEDGIHSFDSVMHYGSAFQSYKSVKSWYIGRPYLWLELIDANDVTIGPTLTSAQVSDFFNNVLYTLSVSDAIYLYQAEPPLLTRSFTNATYVNAHLFVPNGYKTMYENAPIWKNFVFIEEFDYEVSEHEIEVISSNSEAGVVSGGGTYHFGETVTITATSNTGYYFNAWTEGGVVVSRDREYTFGVTGDRRIVANFNVSNNNEFEITAMSNNPLWGTVSGAGMYHDGETATISAIPFGTNLFENWTENGVWVSGQRDYSFVVNGNRNLVANFRYKGLGIEEEIAPRISVLVDDRELSIYGVDDGCKVLVFNGLGQIVYQGFEHNIHVSSAGLFIVAIENVRIKVVVE